MGSSSETHQFATDLGQWKHELYASMSNGLMRHPIDDAGSFILCNRSRASIAHCPEALVRRRRHSVGKRNAG